MHTQVRLMLALRSKLRRLLEQEGFKPSKPRKEQDVRNKILECSYRVTGACLHALDIQYERANEAFCMNLGVHFRFLPLTFNDELPVPSTTESAMCIFDRRLAPEGRRDQWWFVPDSMENTVANVQSACTLFQESGLEFFEAFGRLPGPYESITLHNLKSGEYKNYLPATALLPGPALVAAMMAYVCRHRGQPQKALEFAQFAVAGSDKDWQHRMIKYLRFVCDEKDLRGVVET